MNAIFQNYNGNWICSYDYYYGTVLNNLCWVTEIPPRQVAFVAIMRPPIVAHTIRELALCRDDNSTCLLTSVEMSQIIEYLCTI